MMTNDPGDTSARRRFLARLTIALTAFGAVIVAVPAVTFIMRGLFRIVPQEWRRIGAVDDFETGRTVLVSFEAAHADPWASESGRAGAWLRREPNDEFTALSLHCTHLGCPVAWQAEAGLFLCPCHGGVYHDDGSVASGPPLRPLPRHPVRVRNGEVEIETRAIPMA